MDTYTNKIFKIKSTIDDIRDDIETMKNKNENTINIMMDSFSKINKYNMQESYQEDNSEIMYTKNRRDFYYEKEGYPLVKNFDINNYYQPDRFEYNNKNKNEINRERNTNSNIYSKTPEVLYGKNNFINNENKNDTIKYINRTNNDSDLEKQISELKITMNELKNKNDYLETKLNEYNRDFNYQNSNNTETNKRNESIMKEIKFILKTDNVDDILPILKENFYSSNTHNKKDEFVEKLNELFYTLTGSQKLKENIELKALWRWIKHIINQVSEKESIEFKDGQIYKNFCENLIKEYNLRNMDELQVFINELLNKNSKNQRRVEKIKQLLLLEPTSTHINYIQDY